MRQTPSVIGDLLRRHGIVPNRSLGQHFLADPNLVAKVAGLADPGSPVLEIGAGTGALTSELARRGHRVVAFEIDLRLKPLLEEILEGVDNVELHFDDVTHIDVAQVLGVGEWSMVSNLPYHVGTPVLLDLLRHVPAIRSYAVMVQREVGERLVASPGTRAYGLPSVIGQLYAQATLRFRVPPQVFVPPPEVDSVVVTLRRRQVVPTLAESAIVLASRAFGQRRKMLRASLSRAIEDVDEALTRAGIDGRLRAEDLTPDQYLTLAEAGRP